MEAWLKANGCHYPRLAFRHSEVGGRGLVATEDLAAGEEMCSIPVGLALTTDHARRSEVGQLALAHLADQAVELSVPVGRAVLCSFMIKQRAEEDSFWGPYLRALPTSFTTPLYWTEEELQHIVGTNLFYSLQDKKQPLREAYGVLFPALSLKHPETFAPSMFTWDNFLWAYTVCSSRSFPQTLVQPSANTSEMEHTLEMGECLLPGLDMLNHKYKKKVTWSLDEKNSAGHHHTKNIDVALDAQILSERLRFITDDPLERGMEAFNNYGPKGNEELLMGYGFCIDENEQDYVMIRLSFSESDVLVSRKKALLKDLGLDTLHAIRYNYIPQQLLDALRVSVMIQQEIYFFNDDQQGNTFLPQRTRPTTDFGSLFINWRNELEVGLTLKSLLEEKARKLGPIRTFDTCHGGNVRNAIIYKNGQRHVLETCIAIAKRLIAESAQKSYTTVNNSIGATMNEDTAQGKDCYHPPPYVEHTVHFTRHGIYVAQNVESGSPLISIPQDRLISLKSALASPLGEAIQHIGGDMEEDTLLMLFMIQEKARGKESPWYTFLNDIRPKRVKKKERATSPRAAGRKRKAPNILDSSQAGEQGEVRKKVPKTVSLSDDAASKEGKWFSEIDLPLVWNTKERDSLGPDFGVASGLSDWEEGLKELFSQMFPALSLALPQYFPSSQFTWANFRWAASTLEGHSVRVTIPYASTSTDEPSTRVMAIEEESNVPQDPEAENGDEQDHWLPGSTITLVLPLAVLPQHHPLACTFTALRSENGRLELNALTAMRSGTPVFMTVGRSISNAELMLRRGRILSTAFSTPSTCNPFDYMRFPFPAQVPLSYAKLALLRRNGLEEDIRERSHILRAYGPLPSKLIDTLRIIFLSDESVEQILRSAHEDAQREVHLPKDADLQVQRLIDGTLRGLASALGVSAETKAPNSSRPPVLEKRTARRALRSREYRLAQEAVLKHNREQIERWAATTPALT